MGFTGRLGGIRDKRRRRAGRPAWSWWPAGVSEIGEGVHRRRGIAGSDRGTTTSSPPFRPPFLDGREGGRVREVPVLELHPRLAGESEAQGERGRPERAEAIDVRHHRDSRGVSSELVAHEGDRVARAVARGPARHELVTVHGDEAGPRGVPQEIVVEAQTGQDRQDEGDSRRGPGCPPHEHGVAEGGQDEEGDGRKEKIAGKPAREEGGEGQDGKDGQSGHEEAAPIAGADGGGESEEAQDHERPGPVRPEPAARLTQVGEETSQRSGGILGGDVDHPLRVARREKAPEGIPGGGHRQEIGRPHRAPRARSRAQQESRT